MQFEIKPWFNVLLKPRSEATVEQIVLLAGVQFGNQLLAASTNKLVCLERNLRKRKLIRYAAFCKNSKRTSLAN